MANEIFLISDTHFTHDNMYNFLDEDGSKVRPMVNSYEGDAIMIENWNKIVSPNDKVYHLGDLGFNRNRLDVIMPMLNGTKILIKGNHDIFKPNWYLRWFKDIRGCHNLDNYLLTHVPVHPGSKARFKRNLHGHTHQNKVMLINKDNLLTKVPDDWYYNCCVELNNYSPIPFDLVRKKG